MRAGTVQLWTWLGVGFVVGAGLGAIATTLVIRSAATVDDAAPLVARYEGGEVTAKELGARLSALGTFQKQASMSSPESRRKVAESAVLEEVQVLNATALGYHQLSEVRSVCDGTLARVYREREFEAKVAPKAVPEVDLNAAFEARKGSMSRPAQARIAMIFVPAGGEDRSKARSEAGRIREQARVAQSKTVTGFATVARERSKDPATANFGGELPFLTREELALRQGSEVADAAFEIEQAGEISPVVETPKGFFVLRLLAREEAVLPTLEDAAPVLRAQMLARMREEALARWHRGLLEAAQLRIDEAELSKAFAQALK